MATIAEQNQANEAFEKLVASRMEAFKKEKGREMRSGEVDSLRKICRGFMQMFQILAKEDKLI